MHIWRQACIGDDLRHNEVVRIYIPTAPLSFWEQLQHLIHAVRILLGRYELAENGAPVVELRPVWVRKCLEQRGRLVICGDIAGTEGADVICGGGSSSSSRRIFGRGSFGCGVQDGSVSI